MNTKERKAEVIRILQDRKWETMANLAKELGVTARTIRNYIRVLKTEYPLRMVRGNGGCVKVEDWHDPPKHILSRVHQDVLMQMLGKANEYQQCVLQEIIVLYGDQKSNIVSANITIKELSQLHHLNKEIEQDSRRLAELETAIENYESLITGLPHIKNIEEKIALAADVRSAIETKKQLCTEEYNRLMKFITSIDDSYIRQIFSFRYINGFSWLQVAMNIGGGNTEDSIRMAHKRYFEKQK